MRKGVPFTMAVDTAEFTILHFFDVNAVKSLRFLVDSNELGLLPVATETCKGAFNNFHINVVEVLSVLIHN